MLKALVNKKLRKKFGRNERNTLTSFNDVSNQDSGFVTDEYFLKKKCPTFEVSAKDCLLVDILVKNTLFFKMYRDTRDTRDETLFATKCKHSLLCVTN